MCVTDTVNVCVGESVSVLDIVLLRSCRSSINNTGRMYEMKELYNIQNKIHVKISTIEQSREEGIINLSCTYKTIS